MPRHLPFRIITLGLLISACVDQPTAPESTAPVPFGRAASASASFSASHTIPVPGSTLLEFGTVRLAPTGIVIPRDMWVRVRVSGSVRIDADPEWVRRFCNPGPPSECPPPYDGASAGPLGVEAGLEVQVAMNNAYFLWRPRAAGGDGAEDIMFVSAGTKVLAGRAGLWEYGDCWGCTHEPGRAGRYRLSGSQTLTVEEINPLSVRADRTEVDPADPVSFTARADEEMRNLQWAFVAGDTLPEGGPSAARVPAWGASFSMAAAPSALTADWNALASCRGKEACTTPVAVSGRMWVRGHIENQIVFAKSQIVRVQLVRLKLDCTPNPVTRGQSISCTARAEPGSAQITGVQWNFVDSAGHNIAGPKGDNALSWGGTMVVGGTMHVSATIDGEQRSDSTKIRVDPRPWRSPLPRRREFFYRCAARTTTCLALYPPEYEYDLGSTVTNPRGVRLVHRAETLTSGPNTGWSYLSGSDSPVQFSEQIIALNDVLNPANVEREALEFWAARPSCDRATILKWVREHEYTHANMRDENMGFLDASVESRIAYVPKDRWVEMTERDGEVTNLIASLVWTLAGGQHVDSRFSSVPCDLRLKRTAR